MTVEQEVFGLFAGVAVGILAVLFATAGALHWLVSRVRGRRSREYSWNNSADETELTGGLEMILRDLHERDLEYDRRRVANDHREAL